MIVSCFVIGIIKAERTRKVIFFPLSLSRSLSQDAEGDRAVEMALREPERFVLKPQREGGGEEGGEGGGGRGGGGVDSLCLYFAVIALATL